MRRSRVIEGQIASSLAGKRVLVTRAREQASALSRLLAERGAVPIELATIQLTRPSDLAPLDAAIRGLDRYDWVIFTSANGVRHVHRRIGELNADPRALANPWVAAIGTATASALSEIGIRADVVPPTYVAEAMVEELRRFDLAGKRVLLLRAQEARDVVEKGLARLGAVVDVVAVYQTVPVDKISMARQRIEWDQLDAITLTSSSTAKNLIQLVGDGAAERLRLVAIAAIGPITSKTARDLGLVVSVEATEHTIPGLVSALERYFEG